MERDRTALLCHFTTDHIRRADGGLYVCTPVDPLLVVLPLLERARGAGQREGGEGIFCDPEQILQVGRLHNCTQLQPCRWYGFPVAAVTNCTAPALSPGPVPTFACPRRAWSRLQRSS